VKTFFDKSLSYQQWSERALTFVAIAA